MSAAGRATDFMQAWGEGHGKPHGQHGWGADDCDRCTAEAFGPWEALIYAAEIMGWVATPPAEPAARVTRESIQHVADAILAEPFRPAPSQPVTCEEDETPC